MWSRISYLEATMSDESREHSGAMTPGTDEGFPYGSQADQPLSFALRLVCFVFPAIGLIMALVMMKRVASVVHGKL